MQKLLIFEVGIVKIARRRGRSEPETGAYTKVCEDFWRARTKSADYFDDVH